MKILATIQKENQKAYIHIVGYYDGRLSLMVENKDGMTQFPIKTSTGIAYDSPGKLPKYIKRNLPFAFDCLDALKFARKYPENWQSFSNDKRTRRVMSFLHDNGLILINDFSMFKMR